MRYQTSLALAAALLLSACSNSGGTTGDDGKHQPKVCTFVNPIMSGADPWVIRRNGFYYLVQSRSDGIWVYKSQKLTEINSGGVRVWTPPATGWNRENIWAPELHFINGRWYIYYAAGPSGAAGATFVNQRAFVLESAGEDPQGAYTDRGMLYTGDDVAGGSDPKWAIDLTVGTIGGQLYAVWSGWEQNTTATDRTVQHLYIARMSDPATIATNRVKLSSPTAPWEVGSELSLQEGPEFLEHNGQLFLIYSTRESWLREYRLGQLRLTAAADPMVPASWTKSGPVFQGTDNVFGTGHASFSVSPDGTEDWIIYHAKVSTTPGWDRVVRMQPFTWNADGSPNFGTPVTSGQRIPAPSGECPAPSA